MEKESRYTFYSVWVRPRWKSVLDFNLLISFVLAITFGVIAFIPSPLAREENISVIELAQMVLSFASFGLAIIIPALTLLFAFPSGRLMRILKSHPSEQEALERLGKKYKDGKQYEELIFVFLWSGLAQLVAAGWALSIGSLMGKAEIFVNDWLANVGAASLIGVVAYALLQILSSLKTLADIINLQAQLGD